MRRHTLFLLLSLVALSAACAAPPPENTLRVSGNVEAIEVRIGAEVGGRVLELLVAEGDRVEPGTLVATLDVQATALQIERVRAERAAAMAQVRLLEAGARTEDLRQAEAQRDAAQAEGAAIDAEVHAAQLDLERFESLLKANAGSEKQRDDARARADAAVARQNAARERIRAAAEVLKRLRSGARPEELQVVRAHVAVVDAQIASLEKSIRDAQVMSTVTGVVTQKLIDAGELVGPGTPLVVVTDLDHAWANLFVPEPMVPRVSLGKAATIFTDAGGAGLQGTVTFVSPKAEFTPRNVQTAEERSKLVYRIKVSVDNREGVLKSGMPVDAELALP
jgi:HlyD family secretion protein